MPESAQPRGTVIRRELAIAAFLAAFGGVVIAAAGKIEPGVYTDPLGPRFFPIALGAGILLCGLLLAAAALLFGGQPEAEGPLSDAPPGEEAEAGPFSPARLILAIGATAVYVALFGPLGHLLATPPYVAGILLIHGGAPRRTLLIVPFLITIVLYVTFRFGLLIPVPEGPLEGLLPW